MSQTTAEIALEALLQQVAAGDGAAFRQLYDRTSGKLFGVVIRILRNPEKANDALQDVYLKIWQKAESYNPSAGRPITWMAAIARNRAIDIVRAERPETTVDEPGDEEEIFRLGGQNAEGVSPEELETLRHCMGEMRGELRQTLLLAYYDGYSREELAERFDAPVGTIKTRLRRGLASLRECLER